MSRIQSRVAIFKIIFEYLHSNNKNELLIQDFKGSDDITDTDYEYIIDSVDNIIKNIDKIYDIINKYAHGYTVNTIYKVDLAALVVCVYEIVFNSDQVPPKSAINATIDIVKDYSTENSQRFVNGVLAGVYKEYVNE